MLSDRPRVGIVFSLLAGILMLVVWVGSIGRPIYLIEMLENLSFWWKSSAVVRLCFVMGWAVLILVGVLVLYIAPKQHSLGGVIILAFSILTLLLWVGGFILRYFTLALSYPRWFSFLFRNVFGSIEILSFDVLAFASVFGIIGGVSGILWKPKPAIASVKQLEAKLNLLGVVSAIMAFNSLALPWWVQDGEHWTLLFPWGIDEGVPLGVMWLVITSENYDLVMYAALAFILISGILGLLGSLVVGKKGRVLLIVAGIFAVLSIVSFAEGLSGVRPLVPVGYNIFYAVRFYAGHALVNFLSFGFWTALAAAILAFTASLKHLLIPSKMRARKN